MDNISIYSLLPLLSSKAKDRLGSSEKRSVLLNSFLIAQGGSGNLLQGFLSSQQIVDKEIAVLDKKEAQDGLRSLIARLLELNNESFNTLIGQQIASLLDTINSAVTDIETAVAVADPADIDVAAINTATNNMRLALSNSSGTGNVEYISTDQWTDITNYIIRGEGDLDSILDS